MKHTPGAFLSEIMSKNGWTQEYLSEMIGKSRTKITGIINDKERINAEWALLLAEATGVSASEWLNLQQEIDLVSEGGKHKDKLEDIKTRRLLYENFPVQELINRGVLPKTQKIDLLSSSIKELFGIKSLNEDIFTQATTFRKSAFPGVNSRNLEVRLKLSEIIALQVNDLFSIPDYSEKGLLALIEELPSLSTKETNGVSFLFEELRKVGVILVVLKHFEKTKIDGACYWNESLNKPTIVISLRYNRLDNFRFTLAHELGHIIKHKEHLKDRHSFIEFGNSAMLSKDVRTKEEQADKFAQETLINSNVWKELIGMPTLNSRVLEFFSKKANVHKSILLGRLKFEGILHYSVMSNLTNTRIDDGIPKEHTIEAIK